MVDESNCGEYAHSSLLMLSYLTVIFNPLVYGFMNHGLQRQLAKIRFMKFIFSNNQINHASDHRETTPGLSRSRHRSESDEARVLKIPYYHIFSEFQNLNFFKMVKI